MSAKTSSLGSKLYTAASVLFGVFILWWAFLYMNGDDHHLAREIWVDSYQLMAIFGGAVGLWIAHHWGATKSVMGRAILAFSFGLLFQSFGQTVYGVYAVFLQVEVPYPSIGDIGFFGSIPLYIYAIYQLGKAAGAKVSFKSYMKWISAIVIPAAMLILSYVMFLQGYEFEGVPALTVFLDFGYPFGQAIYVSLAILVYLLSRRVLGGMMRKPLLVIVAALLIQYVADYTFLYQAYNETWVAGGINDATYLLTYYVMSMGLISVYGALRKFRALD